MGVNGKGAGWGGWWQRLTQRSKMIQMAEFSVAMTMTSTCTHNGTIFRKITPKLAGAKVSIA